MGLLLKQLMPSGVALYTSQIQGGWTYLPNMLHSYELNGKTKNCPGYINFMVVNDSNVDVPGYLGKDSSGLIGWFPQWTYYSDDEEGYVNGDDAVKVPIVSYIDSVNDLDNYIYNLGNTDLNLELFGDKHEADILALPTNGIIFNNIDYKNGVLDYVIQSPVNSQLKEFWPYWIFARNTENNRFKQYANMVQVSMNIIDSGFLSSTVGYNVTIWSSAESMVGNQTRQVANPVPLLGFITIPPAVSFLLPVIVYTLVLDSSSGLLEMSKLKGLPMWAYWLSGYLFFLIYFWILLVLILMEGYVFQIQMFSESIAVTVVLFMLWAMAQNAMAYVISPFFKGERNATIFAYGFSFFAIASGIVLNLFLFARKTAPMWYMLLIPQWTMLRGVYLMQNSYTNFRPLTFTHNWHPEMATVLMVLAIQSVIYMVIGMYLQMVLPKKFGRSEPFYFPILPLVRLCWRKKLQKKAVTVNMEIYKSNSEESNAPSSFLGINMENYPDDVVPFEDGDCSQERFKVLECEDPLRYGLLCREIHKKHGNLVALRSFCLGLEVGECFALLGPNGAGKSTLIQILCGIHEPNNGFAIVNGHRTDEEMSGALMSLGYCPQHDIIFEDLTINEHLGYFILLVGGRKDEPFHVTRMKLIEQVGLADHMHKKVSELSGGMKRRLSLAISLVGDPIVLLLDEPTTGMDPQSRSEIWKIISSTAAGRAVILCTHNMEEASNLSTKIGIMSRGRLVAIGDSNYLKKKYGSGYRLLIFSDSKESEIEHFVRSFSPNSRLDSSYAGVFQYNIPPSDAEVSVIFEAIRKYKQVLKIKEWGFNQSSLEDVFLNIVRQDEADLMPND